MATPCADTGKGECLPRRLVAETPLTPRIITTEQTECSADVLLWTVCFTHVVIIVTGLPLEQHTWLLSSITALFVL